MIGRFVEIAPCKETFFLSDSIPEDIKLSREIIELNYLDQSPFLSEYFVFTREADKLYIWFLKNKPTFGKIILPAGYILYSYVKSIVEHKDAIGILKREKDVTCLVVLKNGVLVSQILVHNKDINTKINLVIKEFSLKEPQVLDVDESELFSYLKVTDVIRFIKYNLPIDKNSILKNLIRDLSLSLAVGFMLLSVTAMFVVTYLNNEIQEEKQLILELKKKNMSLKKELIYVNSRAEFWKTFIDKELLFPDTYNVLGNIGEKVSKVGGYIYHITISRPYVNLWISVKAGAVNSLLDELSSISFFQDLKLLSSTKDPDKEGYIKLEIEAMLRFGK